MTFAYFDISRPLDGGTPLWPDSPGVRVLVHTAIAQGDTANGSRLDMDVHAGTHVDAPRHFVEGGATVDQVGLDPFVGPVVVAQIADTDAIGPEELEAASVPRSARRVLLRTRNSDNPAYGSGPFRPDFAALTPAGARWVVERGLVLVGIDYLSIQRFYDPPEAHHALLGAGVSILEGLDLRTIEPGAYTLICLPLNLVGAEAAPARAILIPAAGA